MTTSEGPQSNPEGIDIAGSRLLLVDDNAQNLELIEAFLEDVGCEIVTTTSGEGALQHAGDKPPDLVLLDIMMPEMSGFQACQRLRALPGMADVPIIMVTALNEVGDVERAMDAGANDFLTKPVNKDELIARIRAQLRSRALRQGRSLG